MVDVDGRQAGCIEAVLNGLARKAGPMLAPAQAFFFDRCHQHSVDDNARSRVAMKRVHTQNDLQRRSPEFCWISRGSSPSKPGCWTNRFSSSFILSSDSAISRDRA